MVDEKLIEQNSELASRLQVLEGKLSCVSSDSDSTDIFFVGCNVHVRDGSGATQGVHQATIQSDEETSSLDTTKLHQMARLPNSAVILLLLI